MGIYIKEKLGEIIEKLKFDSGTILISGATGMIGVELVDCLMLLNDEYNAKFRVIALARNKKRAEETLGKYWGRSDFSFYEIDINKEVPKIEHVDYIVHAASNTHPKLYSEDPIGTIKTNVIGTDNLLQCAVNNPGVRFVFLSSVEIYGECPIDKEVFGESDCGYIDCNQVRAGYPESKRVGESLCRAYESKYGIDVVIPRLCRVYGPTMRKEDSKALSQFIKKAVSGQDIVLKSDGQQFYSYIHVWDAVRAILYIMKLGDAGEAYNVSSIYSNIRLRDLANKLAKIAGTKVIYEIPDETERLGYSKATKAILDNGKLKRLGWSEVYNIDKGLEMTVRLLKGRSRETS